MNVPTVESFLPEITTVVRADRPSQGASPAANEETSFDSCLRTASEKPSDADNSAESSQEAAVENTQTEPKDEQPEKADPGSDAAGQDHEVDLAKLAAAEVLVGILPEQQAVPVEVPVEVHFDTEAKSPAIPVEVIDPQQAVPESSGEALPVEQTQTAQPEFVSQVPLSQATESAAQPTAAVQDEGQVKVAETTDRPVSLELARAVEEEADRIGPQTDETSTSQREQAAPLAAAAPAPENSPPDQQNAITLNTGEQIRVEVRQTGATTSVEAPAAASGDLAVEDSQVIGQVVRGAQMMVSQGRTEVRVRLQPPELGVVRVELTSDQNNMMVEARITAERDEVRQLIERNLPQLRESLSASGVEVGSFDVYTQDPGGAPFGESAESSSNGSAWGRAEPEEQQLTASSGPVRGVNRSTSAGAVDYII